VELQRCISATEAISAYHAQPKSLGKTSVDGKQAQTADSRF